MKHYTSESFPLATVPGRGGLGVTLSLDYNGNVSHIAKVENRISQASPFGLGFSLGQQAIIVDHNGTAELGDDKYELVINDAAYSLHPADTGDINDFLTNSGQPWIIRRDTATVENILSVIGWTVRQEDGTVYRYGDFADTINGWNATENMLRYGSFVGSGVTTNDKPYASQWLLKVVHDPDSLNWVEYSYLLDSCYLVVRDGSGDSTFSSYPYIRASYLQTIKTSAGFEGEIGYSDRSDYQLFHGVNLYEFFYTKKADDIVVRNPDGDTISTVLLDYGYHNFYSDSTFKKLLLYKITTVSADRTDSLPPTEFVYERDAGLANFGSIARVISPTGGIKELVYGVADSSVSFAEADIHIDHPHPGYGYKKLAVAENIFLSSPCHGSGSLYLGYWDGHWTVDTISGYTYQYDEPAVSPDGWAAFWDQMPDSLVVMRYNGGVWVKDSIETQPVEDGYTWIYPSKDWFVLITGSWGTVCDGYPGEYDARWLKRAYYYHWNGEYWTQDSIYSHPAFPYFRTELLNVWMSNNTYAISHRNYSCGYGDTELKLNWGRYDLTANDLADTGVSYESSSWCLENDGLVVGTDFMAFNSVHGVHMFHWNGSGWNASSKSWGSGIWFREICGLSNGFVTSSCKDDVMGWSSRLDAFFLDQTDFTMVTHAFDTNSNYRVENLTGSSHSLGTFYHASGNQNIWEWDGTDWVADDDGVEGGAAESKRLWLFDDGYAWLDMAGTSTPVLRQYNGALHWSDTLSYATSCQAFEFGSSGRLAVSGYVDFGSSKFGSRFYVNDPFVTGQTFEHFTSDTLRYTTTETHNVACWASESCVFRGDLLLGQDTTIFDITAFKLIDRQLQGKLPLTVVKAVKIYAYPDDPNPTYFHYDYAGGLLDVAGVTPRFAQATAFTPTFATTSTGSDGCKIYHFYNDLDTAEYAYESPYYIRYPDLTSSSRYGRANGGYNLDGIVYMTHTRDSADAASVQRNVERFFHSLYLTPDSVAVPFVYRVKLDSTYADKEGLDYKTSFTYDLESDQIRSVIVESGPSTKLVKTITYAYESDIAVANDNALTLVSETMDSTESGDKLSRSKIDYALHGTWQPVKTYAWFDAAAADSFIVTSDTLSAPDASFDTLGNAIAKRNANGAVSSIKYGPNGFFAVASVSNAAPKE